MCQHQWMLELDAEYARMLMYMAGESRVSLSFHEKQVVDGGEFDDGSDNANPQPRSGGRRYLKFLAKQRWKRIAIDVFLTLTATVIAACFYFGVFSPKRRGFFCDDETIQYTYVGDTITLRILVLVSLGIPLLIFIVGELMLNNVSIDCVNSKTRKNVRSCSQRVGLIFLDYVLGIVFGVAVGEVMKALISEHRPDFLDTCRPPEITKNCTHMYITNYSCNSPFSRLVVLDAFKSFPSGHAAMSFYSAVVVIYYTNRRLKGHVSRLFCPVLQLICIAWATYCSISRITDHRHHWWDVVAGVFIGWGFGTVTVNVLLNKFEVTSKKSEKAQVNETVSSEFVLDSSLEQKYTGLTPMKDIDSNHI